MKLLIVLACVILARSLDLQFNEEWENWKKEHEKIYDNEAEELYRHGIWQVKRAFVEQHNANADQHGYTVTLNFFSDLATNEYKHRLTYNPIHDMKDAKLFVHDSDFKAEKSLNWTAKGAVTPVGNEFQCGSCWAFSAAEALEGQHFLKTGKLISLSEQQLMDCSSKYGNQGCEGGLMINSYQYIIKYGLEAAESYPYKGGVSQCKYNASKVVATCTGYVAVPQDELALFQAVQNIGPVAVAMDAAHPGFEMYKSGVYYEPQCSSTRVDHTALAVGFGTLNGKEYWLVKNSWGTSWGDNGYILMARNRNNNCGIATQASYPTV